jgi:hypothetical protein
MWTKLDDELWALQDYELEERILVAEALCRSRKIEREGQRDTMKRHLAHLLAVQAARGEQQTLPF